jgi:hypothetical protein
MGGFLPSPSPSPSAPSLPSPAPGPDLKEVERQNRLDALARKRRGLAGTVSTSPRGLLALTDWAPKRKSLLGE